MYLETEPASRRSLVALGSCAVLNGFCFDFQLRQHVQTNFNRAMLGRTRWPDWSGVVGFLAHEALRLNSFHSGYEALWREQVGDAWREPKPPFTWPVLETDDERWEVRAAIDAVVADAYGLSREQYEHVLSTFSHKSYPKAPALCLAKFDELKVLGLEAFTRKHDPYHDIPLNENLPQPVIDLPGQGSGVGGQDSGERPTNLLGEPLPVNLLGEVEYGSRKGRRRT